MFDLVNIADTLRVFKIVVNCTSFDYFEETRQRRVELFLLE